MKKAVITTVLLIIIGIGLFWVYRLLFSPERLNILGRTIETTIGFDNGVVEFYSCGKLIKRFLKVEKLTTAKGTNEKQTRPYRFGFGYIDINLDGVLNKDEIKIREGLF